jgi:Fibronectin type III domain
MKKSMCRPVLVGLAIAALLISALAATSYPAQAALSAHAAIGSNTPVPAAPSNMTARAVGATSIQLTWTNNAGNQSGVVISLDGKESVDVQGATVSSYTWNGLSPNTKYWFYVASKIYGTPGDPTGYGNTQSAWVGPAYATTASTQPSASPAPQPSTSPAPQPSSTSPGAQPSTSPAGEPSKSPAPQPSTAGPGMPTTLPTQPSPTFVCVTGPGGSCLQPGAGLPVPQTWTPTVPGWVTSGVTGGCLVEVWALTEDELLGLFEKLGDAIQFDESNGNFFILLSGATEVDYCSQLYNDLRTGKPVPQNIDFTQGTTPQSGTVLDSLTRPASPAAAPSLFQPVPQSQLASIEELPFLRQRFGYAVAEVGAAAALSHKYPVGWGAATQKSVACRPQQGGYRCAWSDQLNGAHHSGYVLIAVTANNYRLGKVARAAPASPASSLSPLWYISIAVVLVIVAIVVAVLRRRRRATATAQ